MGHGYSFGVGAAGWRAPRSRTVSNRSRASGRWLTMTTLRPSVAESTSSRTAVAVAWSRCAVGSSRSTSGRSASTARATPSRARSPPERPRPPLPSRVSRPSGRSASQRARPARSSAPLDGGVVGVRAGQAQVRAQRGGEHVRLVVDDGHVAAHVVDGQLVHVDAVDGVPAPARVEVAGEHREHGALARAVRADDGDPVAGSRCRSVGASCSPWPVHDAATPSRSTRRAVEWMSSGHRGDAGVGRRPAPGRAGRRAGRALPWARAR